MTKSTTLIFDIGQKEILNSNSMPSHPIVKGKMVSALRELGARTALKIHPLESQAAVEERLEIIAQELALSLSKRRFKKRLEKAGKTDDEIKDELLERYPDEAVKLPEVAPVMNQFTMRVTVFPPTRRRLDPPNLWPTVKALTDGGTDAAVWADDDFAHLLETSFRYGGLSGEKSMWRLELKLTEVEDTNDFQLVAELPEKS